MTNDAAKNLLGAEIGPHPGIGIAATEVLDAVNDVLGGEYQRDARISLTTSVHRSFDIQVTTIEAAAQSDARTVLIMHDMTAAQNAEQIRADFVANMGTNYAHPCPHWSVLLRLSAAPRETIRARATASWI